MTKEIVSVHEGKWHFNSRKARIHLFGYLAVHLVQVGIAFYTVTFGATWMLTMEKRVTYERLWLASIQKIGTAVMSCDYVHDNYKWTLTFISVTWTPCFKTQVYQNEPEPYLHLKVNTKIQYKHVPDVQQLHICTLHITLVSINLPSMNLNQNCTKKLQQLYIKSMFPSQNYAPSINR